MRKPPFERTTEKAGTRVNILVLTLVLLGLAAGAFWYSRHGRHQDTVNTNNATNTVVLSDSTKAVLKGLDSTVEIHFYSLLDHASVPPSTFVFADRITRMLTEYQRVADGKISVTVFNASSDANAASADGIKPFNLDKGDACFLGLTVGCGGRKESLPQLQPEWEPALEFDLDRVILHVTTTPAPVAVTKTAQTSPEITNEIARLIPDLKGTSLEDGTRILREAAFKKFTEAGAEMENLVNAAQKQLSDAQNGKSEAEQQAAMKHLQEVQFEHTEKLKLIAAQLQAQIELLGQLKAAAH